MRIRAIGLDVGDHFQTDDDATVYVVVSLDAWTHRRNKIVGRCESDGRECTVPLDDMIIWRDDLDHDSFLRGMVDADNDAADNDLMQQLGADFCGYTPPRTA